MIRLNSPPMAFATRLFFSIFPSSSSSSSAKAVEFLCFNPSSASSKNPNLIFRRTLARCTTKTTTTATTNTKSTEKIKKKPKTKTKTKTKKNQLQDKKSSKASVVSASNAESLSQLKKRTRSNIEFNHHEHLLQFDEKNANTHIPVMLGEILEVFHGCPQRPLRSFVDCTVGAAGHSSAIIQSHPELQFYIGLDVDPIAQQKAEVQINVVINEDSGRTASNLKVFTRLKNFKDIKSVLAEVDEKFLIHGVDGILMDLGVSSMQVNNAGRGFSVLSNGPLDMRMNPKASLTAEDIVNFWPEAEVGRILREYGEESNWRSLQAKIVKARTDGGLHTTGDLANLVRSSSPKSGGRQGWIKTATRVFQALRIAVNDELKTLEDAVYTCFDCLSSGGRLAVISFHSLEDRIVKKTFLDIINMGEGNEDEENCVVSRYLNESGNEEKQEEEAWIKQRIHGRNGIILTKRPITPCEEEEKLNRRCRSAKLRVIQKVRR